MHENEIPGKKNRRTNRNEEQAKSCTVRTYGSTDVLSNTPRVSCACLINTDTYEADIDWYSSLLMCNKHSYEFFCVPIVAKMMSNIIIIDLTVQR